MKRKFKIRIVHYSEWAFKVQYCYYYFIPVWFDIQTWHYINEWGPYLVDKNYNGYGFKSIEDVREHHKKEEKRESYYYEQQKRKQKEYDKISGKIIGK